LSNIDARGGGGGGGGGIGSTDYTYKTDREALAE